MYYLLSSSRRERERGREEDGGEQGRGSHSHSVMQSSAHATMQAVHSVSSVTIRAFGVLTPFLPAHRASLPGREERRRKGETGIGGERERERESVIEMDIEDEMEKKERTGKEVFLMIEAYHLLVVTPVEEELDKGTIEIVTEIIFCDATIDPIDSTVLVLFVGREEERESESLQEGAYVSVRRGEAEVAESSVERGDYTSLEMGTEREKEREREREREREGREKWKRRNQVHRQLNRHHLCSIHHHLSLSSSTFSSSSSFSPTSDPF